VTKPAGGDDPATLFARAYQHAVDRWPVPVTSVTVPTGYGATHVLNCGAETAPAALLLPGGGATPPSGGLLPPGCPAATA
jgi:hypothetical protein